MDALSPISLEERRTLSLAMKRVRASVIPPPRMAAESLEALAAVVYAAVAEYSHRCMGEMIWPSWGRAEPAARELWMKRAERELTAAGQHRSLHGEPLSEVRRYLLVRRIVSALTAAA